MAERDEIFAWLQSIANATHDTDAPAARLAPLARDRLKTLETIADYAWQCVVLDNYNDAPHEDAWDRLKEAPDALPAGSGQPAVGRVGEPKMSGRQAPIRANAEDVRWLREQIELHRNDSRFAYAYSDLCVRYLRIAKALERASPTVVTTEMVDAAIATTGNLQAAQDEVFRDNVRRMLEAALRA